MNLLTCVANYCAFGLESVNFLPWLSPLAVSPPFLSHDIDLSHLPTSSSRLAFSAWKPRLTPSCLLSSLCNPTFWPYTSPPSFPPFHTTLDGPFRYLFPPSRNPHLISLNLFPSLHVGVRSPLWSGWHFDSHACHITQREALPSMHDPEVPLMCERNAHTNGRGFSLMCSLLFENVALYGEWVFHWVCKSRKVSEARMKEHLITWQT